MKPYLEAGEFVTTHGVAGELKLYPWSDNPQFLLPFATLYMDEAGKRPVKVEQMRIHKNMCLVKLEGVNSITEARHFIGRRVYIARADADIGEGRVFVQDLLGAKVVHAETGEEYGAITAVTHPGRHDVYEIMAGNGDMFLFPAVKEFVTDVDVGRGVVKVLPIEGMFEAQPDKKTKGQETGEE